MELTKINSLVLKTAMPVVEPDAQGNGGESLEFSYRIGAMDAAFWEWYYDRASGGDIFDVLERVLATTGITVAGAPVAPTAEALRGAIPGQFARAMFEHIKAERQAGKVRAASSE